MKRLLVTLMLVAIAPAAAAFQPRTGHWWNPAESGRGFNIDVQENVLVVAFYSYNPDGSAQWYLASGTMTNDRHDFTGVAQKYANGQCLACAYSGSPNPSGNDGILSIAFTSETSAMVTLPGGRRTPIQPFNFAYGDPPRALLGEWVYVEDILITFADRFDFTVTAPGTPDDTGHALDVPRRAGCAYQKSGVYAGLVWCLDLNSAGAIENEYRYRFGLDETYGGVWVSQTTGSLYAMKGFKTASAAGSSRKAALVKADDPTAVLKAVYDDPAATSDRSAALEAQRAAFADAIRRASRPY
jgi:hypothetical protein